MKKTIFVLNLFLLTVGSQLYSQSPQREKIPPISKTTFLAKTNELSSLLNSGSKNYMAKWDELNEMMITEFAVVKQRIYEAGVANDNSSEAHYNEQMDKQLLIYREIISMRNNSFRDVNKLNSSLQQYSNELIN